MNGTKLATIGAMAAAAIGLAAPAQAAPPAPMAPAGDYDAPFKVIVNGFGIFGPQDQLAWVAKISCERMDRGVDGDAYKAADFVQHNLPRGTTQGQAFQFLGAGINHYCPRHVNLLQAAGR